MRSFRTLYESHGTWKKSSEQLRSRSIHWWPRMVRPGTEKCKKRSPCFMLLGRCDIAMLLTARILMFWCFGRLWKLKFRLQKLILIQNVVKNIFLTYFQFFGFPKFSFLSFSNFVIFLIFMSFKILGSKIGRWVGSLQKLFFTRGGKKLRSDVPKLNNKHVKPAAMQK